jgi:hypothetical protein
MIDAARFYAEYKGHPLDQLDALHAALAQSADVNIFLCGDSSLDNKHWFFDGFDTKEEQLMKRVGALPPFLAPAVNGYETLLEPPRMVKDVGYWMNYLAAERLPRRRAVTFNAAVEESTLGERVAALSSNGPGLLPHDEWIRSRFGSGGGQDVVVLSIGGNDVALKPSTATIASVFILTRLPLFVLRALGRWAPGFGHLESLFHGEVEAMVQRLVTPPQPGGSGGAVAAFRPPALVVVCMIYYLDEAPGGSWADHVLARLGYDADPTKLKFIIKLLFETIKAKDFQAQRLNKKSSSHADTQVLPFPLFEVLDGSDTNDYVQRVEPSVQGGRKIASALLDFIAQHTPSGVG